MKLEYEPVLGRQWTEIGGNDCFRVVRDIFDLNFKIKITNFARPKDWDADKLDIIGEMHEREGFYKLLDWDFRSLKPGDVLAIALGSHNPNHLAVYVGENLIVHQLLYQMSKSEILRDFWRNSTCYVLRHKDVPDMTEQKPTIDIMEIINGRYKVQAETEAQEG